MIKRECLFKITHDEEGHHDARAHLAQIIGFFGPPTRQLLTRHDSMYNWPWPYSTYSTISALQAHSKLSVVLTLRMIGYLLLVSALHSMVLSQR